MTHPPPVQLASHPDDSSVPSRRRRFGLALGLAASLATAVGCGSDDGGGLPESQTGGLTPGGAGSGSAGAAGQGGASGGTGGSSVSTPSGGTEGLLPSDIPLGSSGASGESSSAGNADAGAEPQPESEPAPDAGSEPVEPVEPAGYAPCPTDGTPCRIMPLGDSITHGFIPGTANASDGGYRVELFRQAVIDGHDITFVGPQPPNGPNEVEGQPFPRNHAGISGDTVPGVSGRVNAAIAGGDPHIILLHIGTNDLTPGQAAPVLANLENLLDQITENAPDALLVVAQIIPRQQGNGPTEAYNAGIPALVAERTAQGDHLVLADMYTPFAGNANFLGDPVHPTVAGYTAMAETWYDAIEAFLP